MSYIFYLEVFFTLLIGGGILYVWRKWTYWNRLGIPNTGPFAQFTAYRNRQAGDVEMEWYEKYGQVYGCYRGLKPVLTIGALDNLRNILIKDFSNFRNHSEFTLIDRRINLNVFVLRDEYWKKMRGIVTPVFTSSKLKAMVECIVPCIDRFITNMTELGGTPISVKKYTDCLTMDVIASVAYGTKTDCLNDPNNELIMQAGQIFKAVAQSFGIFGSRFVDLTCFDYISQLTLNLVEQRRQENLTTSVRRGDFLQVLVDAKFAEQGPTLSDDEICSFGISFFSDGYDTTSNSLTALSYFLATEGKVQEKLAAEVSKVSDVNADTVGALPYLEAVLKEVFRLWPPGYRTDRYTEADYKLEGTDITIPKGMIIEIPIYAIQRDPKIFPDPLVFKPERYLPGGQNENFNQLSILTFGAGPRGCIAQRFTTLQIKLIITKVLQKLKFQPTLDTKLEAVAGDAFFAFTKDVYVKIVPR